jgi:hypothetical protein
MNRATPVYMQLSNTSNLLADDLIPLMEEFWKYLSNTSLQFKEEVLEFGNFLMNKIESGQITMPYLKEVLQLEIAMNELSYLPEGEYRILKFEYDIFQVLQFLSAGTLITAKIEKTDFLYKMYMQNLEIQIDLV